MNLNEAIRISQEACIHITPPWSIAEKEAYYGILTGLYKIMADDLDLAEMLEKKLTRIEREEIPMKFIKIDLKDGSGGFIIPDTKGGRDVVKELLKDQKYTMREKRK